METKLDELKSRLKSIGVETDNVLLRTENFRASTSAGVQGIPTQIVRCIRSETVAMAISRGIGASFRNETKKTYQGIG